MFIKYTHSLKITYIVNVFLGFVTSDCIRTIRRTHRHRLPVVISPTKCIASIACLAAPLPSSSLLQPHHRRRFERLLQHQPAPLQQNILFQLNKRSRKILHFSIDQRQRQQCSRRRRRQPVHLHFIFGTTNSLIWI